MIELATEVRGQDRRFELPMERIRYSEELGYDAVFTAEGLLLAHAGGVES